MRPVAAIIVVMAAAVGCGAEGAATTPPGELLRELDELGSGASAALSSSTHWHLRSIGDVERLVLGRLTVFQRSIDPDAALTVVAGSGVDLAVASEALGVLTERRVVGVDGDRLVVGDRFRDAIRSWPHDTAMPEVRRRYIGWFTEVVERFAGGGGTMPVSWIADELADVMAALGTARASSPRAAYRLIRSIGPRWHELDRWEELIETSAWLATRSPSDGELDWAAAVARLTFAAAGLREAEVHRLRDEAVAIAGLDGDVASSLFLEFAPIVERRDLDGALDLFDRAIAADVDAVALAIASAMTAAGAGSSFPEARRAITYLASRVDVETFRDPVAAATVR